MQQHVLSHSLRQKRKNPQNRICATKPKPKTELSHQGPDRLQNSPSPILPANLRNPTSAKSGFHFWNFEFLINPVMEIYSEIFRILSKNVVYGNFMSNFKARSNLIHKWPVACWKVKSVVLAGMESDSWYFKVALCRPPFGTLCLRTRSWLRMWLLFCKGFTLIINMNGSRVLVDPLVFRSRPIHQTRCQKASPLQISSITMKRIRISS